MLTEQSYHDCQRGMTYKDRQKQLDSFCPRKRGLRGELIAACSHVMGKHKDDKEQRHILLKRCPVKWQKATDTSCSKGKIQLDVRGKFFAVKGVRLWDRCPERLRHLHFGDSQHSTRCCLEQHDLTAKLALLWARVGPYDLQGPLPNLIILSRTRNTAPDRQQLLQRKFFTQWKILADQHYYYSANLFFPKTSLH